MKSPRVQRVVQLARGARTADRPLRFAVLETLTSSARTHRLRGSDLSVVVRHRTRDVDILREIFGSGAGGRCYEPPEPARRLLDRAPRITVLDLGGNVGLFSLFVFSRWATELVTSLEPDPGNSPLLRSAISRNRLEERWRFLDAAVGVVEGRAGFTAGLFADSHLDADGMHGGDATTVRVVALFALDHHVDLLKMDIEGGEWAILLDPRLPAIGARVLVVEWHGEYCPDLNAHDLAVRLLRAAGYTGIEDGPRDLERDVGVLWAWREDATAG